MALPFLPGNTFNRSLGKQKYHLSHHFDVLNDVSLNVGEAKPGIGGDIRSDQRLPPAYSTIPRGKGSDIPAWVAFDKQVLCFDAFFQEPVYERREEQYRVRNCKIYFYPEDDSIQVVEQRLKNTGIPQGTIIRRHRISKPPPNDDLYYTVEDFNISKQINLYGRTFKITDADEFTKNFLRKLGFPVMAPQQTPADPYVDHRKAMLESMQPLRPYERRDTLKQFLDHDRHVLRFYCRWDDTDAMYGDERIMVLHYFLADDTIEIREVLPSNCGRDATPMFLRRARVPKVAGDLRLPGKVTDRTVLNVFGPMGHGGRYILDSLKTGAEKQEFYTDSDLMIGSILNVYGKKFILCDCDDFTKEYYVTKYGITDFAPIMSQRLSEVMRAAKEVPPYNGFGSEEDSLCSTKGLMPSAPKKDFIKFMEKDRRGLDGNVLRFLAKFNAPKPVDSERRFIVSYYLSDDTILIFEPPIKNSGVIGGKFLERGRIKQPNQARFSTELSQYYTAQDLYVGAVVNFNDHVFLLIDADEYCFNYMEDQGTEFLQSNLSVIMSKLKAAGGAPSAGPDAQGTMPYEQFRCVLLEMTGFSLSEHEVMTVARAYQLASPDCRMELPNLISVAQEELRKANFEEFKKVLDQCQYYDRDRLGVLHIDEFVRVFQSLKVPIKIDLLKALLCKLPRDNTNCVNYVDVLSSLNWRDNPAPPMGEQTNRPDEAWQGSRGGGKVDVVCYSAFIKDLGSS